MRKKQTKPQKIQKYRSKYSKLDLKNAYKAVMENNLPVRRAASMYSVPAQTLRDRFNGVTDHTHDDMGARPLLSYEEESLIVEYVEVMSQLGYGYTHKQLQYRAGELAYSLERRQFSKPLSNNWVYGFLKRWKLRLASLNPRSLEATGAKAYSPEVFEHYYEELNSLLQTYNLADKPQFIYHLDETVLQPNHRLLNIIAPQGSEPQAITSPKSTIVTVVGCANAAGNSVPPFFIFKGKRFMPELLNGASDGVKGTLSDSGLINGIIFEEYLSEHFLPFVYPENSTSTQHILLLYDGHKSRVSPSLIKWAKNKNIILFVLPPHTSHLLQPLDVATYLPFKNCYHSECRQFTKKNMGEKITRYNMCAIACKAYLKAMTSTNIKLVFRKTGIYPYCQQVIPADQLNQNGAFRVKDPVKESREQESKKTKNDSNPPKLSKSENSIILNTKSKKQNNHSKNSPQPSTSGLQVDVLDSNDNSDSDNDMEVQETDPDKCCVCKEMVPPAAMEYTDLILKWAQCDKCDQWVHLRFCSPKKFVRKNAEFLCFRCDN